MKNISIEFHLGSDEIKRRMAKALALIFKPMGHMNDTCVVFDINRVVSLDCVWK
jgi:hypothetical protein